ncbi:hypothetical protein P167DRAFT_237085 [Morchella conica CCBAS932]|uniref:Uncharacterized protein n=1 Tax=Morchella conica CCBAS932 TaxID=1392247 RepID=A0A3N4KK46_9PEZI|nr:hypothetical protein P167DRAFT_237085 [Morchella conica CCBAS932]
MPFLSFLTFTNVPRVHGNEKRVSTRSLIEAGKKGFDSTNVVVDVRVQARYPPASTTTTMVHIGNVSATGLTTDDACGGRKREVRVVCVWVSERALILALRADRPFRGLGLGKVIFGAACSNRERFSHVKPFFFLTPRDVRNTLSLSS